jgi:DNA-directed RNA polymerase subunit K/omega
MPPKKNTKTLYSKTNPVDIASLLINSNVNTNHLQMNPFQNTLNQTGGKRNNVKVTKKNIHVEDSETDSDTDSVSSAESHHVKGGNKKNIKEKNNKKNHDSENDDFDDGELEEELEEEQEEEQEEQEDEELEDIDEDQNKDAEDDIEDNEDDTKSIASENEEADDDDKETLDTNNKCYSKYAKDKDDDFDLDEYFKDDDIVITKTGRVGKPILFKYEKVRLLSDRSRQLAEGAKPMIKNTAGLSHKEIALLELKNKLIPLIIERPIPNAGSERWRLSELEIPDYD